MGSATPLTIQIRVDNGPELISVNLLNYCEDNQISLCHIQPGKPQKNGFIERFNGSFRREFLNAYLFESLSQVRELAWFWLQYFYLTDFRSLEIKAKTPSNSLYKQPI